MGAPCHLQVASVKSPNPLMNLSRTVLVIQELVFTVSLTPFPITLGKAYKEPMLNINPTLDFFSRLSRRLEIQGMGRTKIRKSSMMLKAAPAYIKTSWLTHLPAILLSQTDLTGRHWKAVTSRKISPCRMAQAPVAYTLIRNQR
jgi:hypothetical protein